MGVIVVAVDTDNLAYFRVAFERVLEGSPYPVKSGMWRMWEGAAGLSAWRGVHRETVCNAFHDDEDYDPFTALVVPLD